MRQRPASARRQSPHAFACEGSSLLVYRPKAPESGVSAGGAWDASCAKNGGGPRQISRARLRRIIRSIGSGRFCMPLLKLHKTVGVKVGRVQVGGGAPIVVQSMTLTDTADARATAAQCIELAAAGSEMVRV